MDDKDDFVEKQRALWEKKVAEAKKILETGERVLSALASRSKAQDDEGGESAQREPESSPSLAQVRTGEEVQQAVAEILPDLPDTFTQQEVESQLAEAGKEANRSTLRSNLLMMAKTNQGLRIEKPGKGRRATVFRRVMSDLEKPGALPE